MSRRIQRRRQRSTRRLALILCEGTVESAYFTIFAAFLGKGEPGYQGSARWKGTSSFRCFQRTLQQQDWEGDRGRLARSGHGRSDPIPATAREAQVRHPAQGTGNGLHLCWSIPSSSAGSSCILRDQQGRLFRRAPRGPFQGLQGSLIPD